MSDLPPLDLLVVGAGFAGLAMLHQARRAGLTALALEAADGVGGTWRANRYPGARVDIPSLEYSYGLDEALQQEWHWQERYAPQPELLRYAEHVADRWALRPLIELNTAVAGAAWDEAAALWQVGAADGRRFAARFLVMASGPLSTPHVPDFPGLDRYAGTVLHTARWPAAPVDFTGRRVAVVGTGSSAVQAVPLIAEQAAHLHVFQRTAAYAVPAHNGPLDPAWEAAVKADYPAFRERNRAMRGGFGSALPPDPRSALAVGDAEREAAFEARWRVGGFAFLGAFSDLLTDARANALAAEFVRGKIRSIVHDHDTAERLCPTHTIGCKRLCVDSGYYASFNRPNVTLVDVGSKGGGIDRYTPEGLVAGGREHRFDTLVLATGFDAMTGTLTRLDLRGRDGLAMRHKWEAGPLNYLGLAVAGFPNLFNIAGPGSTSAFTNVIVSIEHHVGWIVDCVRHLQAHGHRIIEAQQRAEVRWMAAVQAAAQKTLFLSCNSWYLGANIPGKPRLFMPMACGFPTYAARCAAVAAAGYEGFDLR